MKRIFVYVILAVLTGLLSCTENNNTAISDSQLMEMRKTSKDFMQELKGVLIKEIQQGGIRSAVSVCSDTAQLLTNEFGLQRGVFVKRVSFNNRNANNFPDDYEKGILNKFVMMHKENKLTETSENIEVISKDGLKYLRYMKPIIIQAECLNCHGGETDIQEETRELIAEKYPNDKAIDYALGDLRGAVSVKKVLE
jgi:hypothetical protein